MAVGDGNARTVAQEIPARGEAQRRCGYVVDLKAVERISAVISPAWSADFIVAEPLVRPSKT